jgi:uncharacterized protein (DUF4213/DUF364 family)
MAQGKRQWETILSHTLEQLSRLYKDNHIQPGRLVQVGIKLQWTMVTGSAGECGIASNITCILPADNNPSDLRTVRQIRMLINRPLFEIAETGITSDDLLERSLGIAVLSALSQRFLSCSAVRKRGYLSECWKATDPFILQYPMISHFVTKDDVVLIIGHGTEIRDFRGKCRELHVMDAHSSDSFSTILINSSVNYGPKDIVIHSGKQDTGILRTANVIFINASSLVDGTFDDLMRYAVNARLVGLCGLSGSLIPDAFFDQGLDFISSFRITDPRGFAEAMANEHDIEYTFRTGQKQYLMMNPSTMSGRCDIHDTGDCT